MALDQSYRAFGRRLAEARAKAGLSQAQLGEAIGVSGPRISHFESGHAFPPRTHHQKIAEVLQVDRVELFGESSEEDAPPRRRLARRQMRPQRRPVQRHSHAAEQAIIINQVVRLLDRMDLNRQRIALNLIRALSRQT